MNTETDAALEERQHQIDKWEADLTEREMELGLALKNMETKTEIRRMTAADNAEELEDEWDEHWTNCDCDECMEAREPDYD